MGSTRWGQCGGWFVMGLGIAVLLTVVSPARAEVRYVVTDLGGAYSQAVGQARAVNDSGQAAGYSGGYAFLYSDGAMTVLNTSPNYSASSHGWGINSAGHVAADYLLGGNYHACIYRDGTRVDLGTLGTGYHSYARDINDSGDAVGYSETSGISFEHAFLYHDGTMTDLGTLPGTLYSFAYGINSSGQIVGRSDSCAFLYSDGQMVDLRAAYFLPTDETCAYAINDSGQIVGYANFGAGVHRSFLISGGTVTNLGILASGDSEAYGINNDGMVVGMSAERAYLYADGVLNDLNDLIDPASGWTLSCATAISDNGLIVGYGINPQGYRYPFMLTPIPEPATTFLLGFGLLAFAARRRKASR